MVVEFCCSWSQVSLSFTALTDLDKLVLEVSVWWDLEVQWCWALSNSARSIIMGTVAWAEVTSSAHTKISNWYATEMCADTEADQVLLVGASLGIGLLVSETADINGVHIINLLLSSVSYEKWLTSPFHGDTGALWDGAQLDLSAGHSHDVLSGSHVSDVLVAIAGYTGSNGGAKCDWVHVAESSLAGSELVLILNVLGAAAWLSVGRVDVVERLDIVAGLSQAELDGLSSHVQQLLMTNPL